jgi:uncharacterized membrane protein
MLFFLFLFAIGLALWTKISIDDLRRSISELQKELAILRRATGGAEIAFAAAPAAAPAPAPAPAPEATFFDAAVADTSPTPPPPEPIVTEEAKPDVPAPEEAQVLTRDQSIEPTPPEPQPIPEAEDTDTAGNLERQFGARLPVWIGGIALALAGFFLVRYTIEIGLLTETVRVALGGVFGLALIAAGHWASTRESLANGKRIGQALSGAGIADLYASLFVATTLYHLLSPAAGFVGLAAVTVGAVALSLRHGAPIAVLGLVGGFLTPLLTGSTEPNAPLLFGYLYCLLAGFLAVIRKKGWWLLAIPTVIAGFGWVVLWLQSGFDPRDAIWPLLFVMAVSATVAFASHRLDAEERSDSVDLTNPISLLRYISLGGGILLVGGLAGVGGFELSDWALFGLLTAGVIALAALQPRIYNFAPLAALVMSFAMFVVWGTKDPDPLTFGLTIVAFGLLHCMSGYVLMWRSPIKAIWGTLVAAAALGYYLLAYAQLDTTLTDHLPGFPIWGVIAFGLALALASIIAELLEKLKEEEPARALLLAGFSVVAAVFITIGLTIEIDRQWLHVAIAGEVLAAVWLAGKVPIGILRPIAAVLLALSGLLILPQLIPILQAALPHTDSASWMYRGTSIDWPIFRFGAPALMLFGASLLLRAQQDDVFVKVVESVTALLAGATIYLLTWRLFHAEGGSLLAQAGELERSVTTSVFFVSGLATLWLGYRFQRSMAVYSALAFALIGALRLLPELMFLLTLAISTSGLHGPRIEWPILEFGIPALALLLASMHSRGKEYEAAVPALESITAVLTGAMIYCLTRQAFHPEGNALLAQPGEIERAVTTNVFLLSGLAALWLGRRFERVTSIYAALAFGVIGLLRMTPELLLLLQLAIWSLGTDSPYYFSAEAIDWPILQLGLPALIVLAASMLSRGQNHEVVRPTLEAITAVLAGAMIYCLTRQAFHPEGNALLAAASFTERGVTTNIFFLTGLAAYWLGRRFERVAWTRAGYAFSAIALFRVVYSDLLLLNPVWSHQFVGDWPLINGLLLTFGLPIAWSIIAARHIRTLQHHNVAAGLNGLGFVLLFVLVTLNVRQFYWGGYIDGGRTFDSEIYAYSAAWLLMGIALLIAGTIRKEQMIRIASLVVMLIAVGKVFLIDASSLEGLYRVMSFFGLGVTLIALSWFYTRYVFVDKEGRPATTPRRMARSVR